MRNILIIVAGLLFLILLGGGIMFFAGEKSLKVGDAAPDFSLQDQNGAVVKLSEFRGKKNVVLAFYIKAFTPG